jgi:hypothetical protein
MDQWLIVPSAKQYKDRIKKWNLNKNIQTDEMEAMIRKQRQRALIHKRSAFRLRDRLVNPEKIRRYINEHPDLNIALNEDEDGSMASAGMFSMHHTVETCFVV